MTDNIKRGDAISEAGHDEQSRPPQPIGTWDNVKLDHDGLHLRGSLRPDVRRMLDGTAEA